jgi:hypothetical protein
MLEFNKKWFRKSMGCWILEFTGKIEKKEDWDKPQKGGIVVLDELTIKKWKIEKSRRPELYEQKIVESTENEINIEFKLLKPEAISDWHISHGGFNIRVWVYAYENLPEEFVSSKRSKVYHKGTCYIVRRIKYKTDEIKGKRQCKRCF